MLHWSMFGMNQYDYGSERSKGLRDWGYVFWDKERIDALGLISVSDGK